MRVWALLLAIALAACGDHVASGEARPSPTPTLIPWISATAHPTPIPSPSPAARPTDVRVCATSDIAALAEPGQGATGWWIRGVLLGNRGATPCVVAGPLRVALLDAAGATVAAAGTISAPTWSEPGWALLDPLSVPIADHLLHPGQARIALFSYGDCAHLEFHSIDVTLAGPTGTVHIAVEPQAIGGRCDTPGQQLGVSSSAIGPTKQIEFPAPSPSPIAFSIEAPAVAFAGESLSYVLRVANTAAEPFTWGEGCPTYLEWLGGREVPGPVVPDRTGKWEPPPTTYVGVAKESHLLNCAAAGAIPPAGERAFEMHLEVPHDAYGTETLSWSIAGPFPAGTASARITFLSPRR